QRNIRPSGGELHELLDVGHVLRVDDDLGNDPKQTVVAAVRMERVAVAVDVARKAESAEIGRQIQRPLAGPDEGCRGLSDWLSAAESGPKPAPRPLEAAFEVVLLNGLAGPGQRRAQDGAQQ